MQLDIYGEALYALSEGREVGIQAGYRGWQVVARTLDWLVDRWDRPDEGIWETHGGRQDFAYSQVMGWAAFDRGLRLAADLSRPADTVRWPGASDAILEQVMGRGWSESEQAFVQYYGSTVLGASLLLVPRVRCLAPKDPGWLATLDAMDRMLVSGSFVYRYYPAASPDGLRGSEGTFSLCTFLHVDALARAGRLRKARYAFEKMLAYANHVGLFARRSAPAASNSASSQRRSPASRSSRRRGPWTRRWTRHAPRNAADGARWLSGALRLQDTPILSGRRRPGRGPEEDGGVARPGIRGVRVGHRGEQPVGAYDEQHVVPGR